MSILKVQGPFNGSAGSGVSTISKAFTGNVTAGNLLVAFANCAPGAVTTGVVTDSLGQTWTPSSPWSKNVNVAGTIFYQANTLGGPCTVTLTCASSDEFADLVVFEFSGIPTSSLLDGVNQTATGSSATPASGNITTTNANDLLFAGCVIGSAAGATGGTSGWTFAQTANGNGYEYNIVSATGTYNATFVSTADTFVATIAAFKAASGGGGTTQKITATIGAGAATSGGVKKVMKISNTI